MVLPVAVLLAGGLMIYAGIHQMTLSDVIRQMFGRPPADGKLGSLSGLPQIGSGSTGGAPVLPGVGSVSGHGTAAVAMSALAKNKAAHNFHYSQQRPIQYNLNARTVNIDCSGFALACVKTSGGHDVSGNNWNGFGYTGDIITHCHKVTDGGKPGDFGFFGPPPCHHMNVYVGGGRAVSMGAEGDPNIGPVAQMGPPGYIGLYRPN